MGLLIVAWLLTAGWTYGNSVSNFQRLFFVTNGDRLMHLLLSAVPFVGCVSWIIVVLIDEDFTLKGWKLQEGVMDRDLIKAVVKEMIESGEITIEVDVYTSRTDSDSFGNAYGAIAEVEVSCELKVEEEGEDE